MTNVKQLRSKHSYQLKITLNYTKPPVWRRFIVDSDIKLPDLHKVIQTVMGWYNSHLHQFLINEDYYSLPDDEFESDSIDYRKVKLDRVITAPKQKFSYEYDFGDGWEHTIVLEKILPKEMQAKHPVCIDGKRNCPPEDCGGIPGYEDLCDIMQKPKSKNYREMIEWLGEVYDPEKFDLESINDMLKEKDFGCITLF